MKNKIVFVILLLILFPAKIKADNYSFNPQTRILSTTEFSMKLSDYWGSYFIADESNSFYLGDSETDIHIAEVTYHNHYKNHTGFSIVEIMCYMEIMMSYYDIEIEYDIEEYLDGYLKDAYVYIDEKRFFIEEYVFPSKDDKSIITLMLYKQDDGTVETAKETFKSDLSTIALIDLDSSPTPTPIATSQKVIVYPMAGSKYHKYPHDGGEFYYISIEDARAKGYTPCEACY